MTYVQWERMIFEKYGKTVRIDSMRQNTITGANAVCLITGKILESWKKMIKPRRGFFTKVLTSQEFKDQIGYVEEATSTDIKVIFKGGRVGKFSFDKNEFIEIHGWFVGDLTTDEMIDALEQIDLRLATSVGSNTFHESTTQTAVSDWVNDRPAIRKEIRPSLKDKE